MRLFYLLIGLMSFLSSPAVANNLEQDESLVQQQATPSRDGIFGKENDNRRLIYSTDIRKDRISLEKRPADAPIYLGADDLQDGKIEAPE